MSAHTHIYVHLGIFTCTVFFGKGLGQVKPHQKAPAHTQQNPHVHSIETVAYYTPNDV
jgi:hypothetical protein